MFSTRIISSLRDISAAEWNLCFPDELEDHAYMLAVEAAGLTGFTFAYVLAYDEKRLVGAAPFFLTQYDLETTLDDPWRKIVRHVKTRLPWLLRVNLAAIGSPCTETACIGVVATPLAAAVAEALARGFEAAALAKGCRLLAFKDIPETCHDLWWPILNLSGYGLVSGLPIAHLTLNVASIEAYLTTLSPGTRKDMRRKLKAASKIRLERVTTLKGYESRLMELYRGTLERADMVLEELTYDYFEGVLSAMPDRSFCHLYFEGDQLLAANLLLHDQTRLLDKFFVMAPEGRSYNLYFRSWFDNLSYCLDNAIPMFQAGQAGYPDKLRLGAKLVRTNMAFKHQNTFISKLLHLAAPLFAADPVTKGAVE